MTVRAALLREAEAAGTPTVAVGPVQGLDQED